MITLNQDEHVALIARRHWWVLTEHLLIVLFLFFIPFVAFILWGYFASQITVIAEDSRMIIDSFIVFGASLFYLFLWLYFCLVFTDYYLDIWLVTNMRILDIEQKGLFHRETSECYLSKIQDITVETKGLMPTFLNYGDLRIQTAAEKREFWFKDIADPNKVKNVILEQYNQFSKGHSS